MCTGLENISLQVIYSHQILSVSDSSFFFFFFKQSTRDDKVFWGVDLKKKKRASPMTGTAVVI